MNPDKTERMQQAFQLEVERLRNDRSDMTDITAVCLSPHLFYPLWVAHGVTHAPWGDTDLYILSIAGTRRVFRQEELQAVLQELQHFTTLTETQ